MLPKLTMPDTPQSKKTILLLGRVKNAQWALTLRIRMTVIAIHASSTTRESKATRLIRCLAESQDKAMSQSTTSWFASSQQIKLLGHSNKFFPRNKFSRRPTSQTWISITKLCKRLLLTLNLRDKSKLRSKTINGRCIHKTLPQLTTNYWLS